MTQTRRQFARREKEGDGSELKAPPWLPDIVIGPVFCIMGRGSKKAEYVFLNPELVETREGSAESGGERGREMAEKPQPVKVLYCGVCSLPAEYCDFGLDFEKCKPWLIQNAPQLYPDLLKGGEGKESDQLANQLDATKISSDGKGAIDSASGSAPTGKQEEVKRLPGGKVKKKDKLEVIIEKSIRNRRKCITSVKGLELFGVKLSEASKKLGKKFATGASVVKGPTEKDHIDVQGDIAYDVVEFITDSWPDVPESAIFFIEDGKKVPAA